MEADVTGWQRKVLRSLVRPRNRSFGATGIPLKEGRTLPFEVIREWSAPAGRYTERWFLVLPESGEVVHEGPVRPEASVHGLQSLTEIVDEVMSPVELDARLYSVVFSLGGVKGGEMEVEAAELAGAPG